MAARVGSGIVRAAAPGVIVLGILLVFSWPSAPLPAGAGPQHDDSSEGPAEIDPLGPNAACYVCHIPFVREELSKVHLREKVTCIQCHGLSAGHANDENIGATPPDVVFKRHEIDASCRECHKEHNVPAREVIARWLQRKRPKAPVCTDCHGTHKIERPEEDEARGASLRAVPNQPQ